jgi:hypothetical protein
MKIDAASLKASANDACGLLKALVETLSRPFSAVSASPTNSKGAS